MPPEDEPEKSQPTGVAEQSSRRTSRWHYVPPLPIRTSPCFRWPPDLAAIARWILGSWFPVSERLIIFLLAIASASLLSSNTEIYAQLSVGWIAQILIRNFLLMFLVAGGLHWYFYLWRRQGDDYRFDARPFATGSRLFTFGSQVHDNMFWTLASGVSVWTAYEVLMLWALANEYAPALSLPDDLPWLILFIILLPLWETTHFFLIHRLIHNAAIYQRVHALHHRNTNVGPWSGLSMHPLEHLIYLSTVLIHFIIPSSPLLIIFHLGYFTLSAATTHTGYEGISIKGRLILRLGTFHHQMHHRFVSCNYGGLETPWDQWTGSFHDGTDESHQRFLLKRRQGS